MRKLLLLLPLLALSGCAALGTTNQWLTNKKNPIVQAAVTAAVTTVIIKDPTQSKQVALTIQNIAKQVLANDSATVAVADLEAFLNTKVMDLKLPKADQTAALLLTFTLESLLNQYIAQNPGGSVTATTQVAIAGLAAAVITACGYYVGA